MEVVQAEFAGACYGVKRALELAQEAACGQEAVQTLGPLIHNPLVVGQLQEQGVGVASSLEEIQAPTLIIRSHGVTPEVYDALIEKNLNIIDATCPHVLRAQKAAYDLAREGYTVLVVGEAQHPEVLGLCAWAKRGGADVITATCAADLPSNLPLQLGIVVQTTQTQEHLDEILGELAQRNIQPKVCDTICSSTSKRQKAACEIAAKVDAMVVVGGRNSSNTTRLFEICQQYAPVAFHIESVEELEKSQFGGMNVVGVTAGASTPDDQIAAVVDCLLTW